MQIPKTVLVFVLALIVFDFYSFEILKPKKHKNLNFFKNYSENQTFFTNKK